MKILIIFRYEVKITPWLQKNPPVPKRLLPPGWNHVITMRHIQEDQVTKFCLPTLTGFASLSFTDFFWQDLLSKLHPLGGGRWCISLNKSCEKKLVKLREAKPIDIERQSFGWTISTIGCTVITCFPPWANTLRMVASQSNIACRKKHSISHDKTSRG